MIFRVGDIVTHQGDTGQRRVEARVLSVRGMDRDPHDDSEDPPQAVELEYDWYGETHRATVAGWRLVLVRREAEQAAPLRAMGEMQYEDRDGRSVAKEGPVVIDGVLHRVTSFYVACDPTMNRRAWNLTMFSAACPVCYPDAKDCRTSAYIQGELAL